MTARSGVRLWGFHRGTFEWQLAEWPPGGGDPEPGTVAQSFTVELLAEVPHEYRQATAAQFGLPARAFDGVPGEWRTMTCPVCWRVSHNPNDARERYCGACHDWPEGS